MANKVIISVGGRVLDIDQILLEVVVDTNLFMPAMGTITIQDSLDQRRGKLDYTDVDTMLKVGAELKIELETDGIPDEPNPVKAVLFLGEITALEPEFSQENIPYLRIRAYDLAHRLTRGKKTRTYGDANPQGAGIDDSTIIRTIVQETSGITGQQIDTSGLSGIKYPYILQYNQTDWEFLWERARLYGYQVYVEDKKLFFQKADAHRGKTSDKPARLTWGTVGLRRFAPRLTLMHQVSRAVVKGWDPHKKETIEGKNAPDNSKTIPQIKLNQKGSKMAQLAFGIQAETMVVNRPVLTASQAKAMASAKFAAAESEFIQAEGKCDQGDPRLIAGRLVTIEGVGERFGGDYYVTEARHVYRGYDVYEVWFKVSGRKPDTAAYLLRGNNGHDPALVYGVVTAKVTDLEDPQALGRVKVMYPWLPKYKDAELSSNWARIATPMGGKDRGLFFTPEIDDEVLVAFEHGDMSYPYIVGMLWNNTDKPPQGTAEVLASDKKKVDQRIIRSRSGHLIILNDKDGEESILIQDKTGNNYILIDSKENKMDIKVKGDLKIEAGGKIDLISTKDMTFDSKAKGVVKTMQDFSLQSTSGKANIKATSGLTLDGTTKAELKGLSVSVNGTADAKIVGTGMVTVQGGLIKLN